MNVPIQGCSGCNSTAGAYGCPHHSPFQAREIADRFIGNSEKPASQRDLAIIADHLKDIKNLLQILIQKTPNP